MTGEGAKQRGGGVGLARSQPTGIRQLAASLDISIGTVSRALNGKLDVNAETRKRVLDAAAALGYVPNQSGRSLRQGTTNAIGFMMETGEDTTANGDTFFMPVFDGVQTVFKRHHLDLIGLFCGSDDDPDAYLRRVVSRHVADGLIISATRHIDPRIDFLAERRIPFVTLGRSLSDGGQPWLDLDFEGYARQSVDRLVVRGHRRIAITAPTNDVHLGVLFTAAYREALATHGIGFDPDLVIRVHTNEEGGYRAAKMLLANARPATAIILISDDMAIGLYHRLRALGLVPGRDMAVIGFRETPQSRFLSPALTCFRMDRRALGQHLAEALLATMPAYAGFYPGGIRREIWPMTLVPGESDAGFFA